MTSRNLIVAAACVETLTGFALIVQPALVVRLLLGGEIAGVGPALGRVAGFGLFSLGLACWPRTEPTTPARRAMLTYNALTTAYLSYLWLGRGLEGTLLVPAIGIHAVFTLLFVRVSLKREWAAQIRRRQYSEAEDT